MNNSRMVLGGAVLTAAAMAGGCNSTPNNIKHAVNEYWAGNYAQSAAILKPETQKKDESFVLNNCRYGSAALAAGNMNEAENAFYDAYLVMNSAKTNDPGRQAAAAIVNEQLKVWKGEPFERAMAHYYLGVIYMTRNDYDNARAAFRNSLFKLQQYEFDKKGKIEESKTRTVDSDFALGYFCLGIANWRMGSAHHAEAEANFKLAIDRQPNLQIVVDEAKKKTTNLILFIDHGQGPRRQSKGWYNEESAFGPTPAEVRAAPQADVYVDGGKEPMVQMPIPMVDTLALAQQRQWQDIDTIKKVKAVVGTGMMAAGAGMAAYGAYEGDWRWAAAGLGTAALGGLLAASSQSDVRYWEMLPRTVYCIPMGLPAGTHQIQVRAGAATSAPFMVTVKEGGQGDSVVYVRLR